MNNMLHSKLFWFLTLAVLPFCIVWFLYGLMVAVLTPLITIFLVIVLLNSNKSRGYKYYRRRYRRNKTSSIQQGINWHVPKISKKGTNFITGDSNSSIRSQKCSIQKIKKNLWG